MSELVIHGRVRRGELDLLVDMAIGDGITALIGANGAGKTSLLRVIAGLDALDEGRVLLDGMGLDEPSTETFVPAEERPVALAFQEPRLFPHLTVLDNIAYPLRRRGRAATAARAQAEPIAEPLGLASLLDLRPGELSGGQAQRVNVGRALAADSPTLLLDEPLASIDDGSREDLRRRLGTTGSRRVVWVTHDPTDLSHADRVISLDDVVQTAPR